MSKRFVHPTFFSSWCLVLLIWQLSASAIAHSQPHFDLTEKNVLILHSLEGNAPIFLGTDKGLAKTLQSGGIPSRNQFFESLDLRRNPGPEHRKLLVEQMRIRYSHRKLDMIITMYPEALEFVLKDCRDVLSHAPILAMHLVPGFELPKTDRLIIGHAGKMDSLGSLEIALRLVPGAKRVYFVSGAHEVDRRIEDQARSISKKWEGQLEFISLSHMPFEKMLATVSSIPPGSILLALGFSRDVSGKNLTTQEVAQRLSEVSPAPIFGILDYTLGYGIAGGSLINFEHIGAKAGELVLDILGGAKGPDNIPASLEVPPVPMFDWRQLRRWKLSVEALPKGSIVINREVKLWDFKYYIIGGLVFSLVETALIVFLIAQRRRKKAAEEKYRNIFESSLEGIFETSPQGQVLTANPAIAKMLGYDSPDDFTSSIRDAANQLWVKPDARADYVRLIEEQNAVFRHECQIWCKNRTKIWVSLSAKRVSGPDGKTLSYSGFVEDITERKRAEEEIAGARAELLRVERSTRLNQLTASLAHELNQPLAAILNNAQAALNFLKADKVDLNEFREILQDIISDDQRAGNVIRSLRSMMKREVGEKKPIILNDIVTDVIQIFHSEAIFRNLRMETELGRSSLLVLADKTQLQQVVLNLVINAAEAMLPNPPERRKIILRTERKGPDIWVTVRDVGPGIDRETLERIFQPFFTTKGTGFGMGLAVCSSIIKDHGGRIWAENNPDDGATFFIELPAYERGRVPSGK